MNGTQEQRRSEDSDEENIFSAARPEKCFTVEMKGVFHVHLSERVRPYLDLIDSLRLMGIDQDLPLPAIAVIGDQSSGKSSVLEALSGVALPRGSGIVTRCPLELRLRKQRGQWNGIISYGASKSFEITDPSQVESLVNTAQKELAGDGVGISNELIRLEIMSPDVCDLTLIDLPGIARVPVKGQPEDIGEQIKKLISSYIERKATINLVVVPCNVDIATTEALKMAKEVDPVGERTWGVLTKPDLVDLGTENNVLDIVHNRVIPLSKGYIVVKCRGQQQIQDRMSLAEATRMEEDFFKKHPYFRCLLNDGKATTHFLATRLTQDLVGHIKVSLPGLSDQIKSQLGETRKELVLCAGCPPIDPLLRKTFLVDILTQFTGKVNQLSAGQVVTDDNLFTVLRSNFQKWKDDLESSQNNYSAMVQDVVNEYDLKHRGRELLGFSSYEVFQRAVQKLVKKLQDPALDTAKFIRDTVEKYFSDISKICFSNYPFLHCVTMNKIDKIQSRQLAKVEERIKEQFQMEQLVYTQDSLYFRILKKAAVPAQTDPSAVNYAEYDSRSKYPEMLEAYYEIVIQRLADQIPMMIHFFLLQEAAHVLCNEMLGLVEGVDVDKALCEGNDLTSRRKDLESRIKRLSLAQEKLSGFL